MKDLTPEEIAALPWYGNEKWSLVNRETHSMRFSSEDKQWLLDNLKKMTPAHPEYPKLQLVERPEKHIPHIGKIERS